MFAEMRDEILGVVTLVGAQRLGMDTSAPGAREHRARGAVFGLGRFGHQNVDAQAIAVLHEHMPAVAQFGRLAVAFPHEPRVWIGGALVGGVRALLAFEVDHPGAVAAVLRRFAILALEAFERGSRFDQGAIDSEMIRGQKLFPVGQADHFVKEAARNIGRNQAFAQSAEIGLIQARTFEIHVEKPAKEDVVVQLLTELPIGAARVQRDQQLPLEQALGRNRRPPRLRVQGVQFPRDRAQRSISQFLHLAKRMLGQHTRLRREVMEH